MTMGGAFPLPRRAALRALSAGVLATTAAPATLACTIGGQVQPVTVAVPERSLAYAPVLLAARRGLYATPAVRLAPLVRLNGRNVAAALADGTVDSGALSLPDFLIAVADGAPLLTIGAVTQRPDVFVLAKTGTVIAAAGDSTFRADAWRGKALGVQRGADGTEVAYRQALTAPPSGTPNWLPFGPPYLDHDPLYGEPRVIAYDTGEALVAALKDGRVDAILARSLPAAQALTLGIAALLGRLPAPGASAADAAALANVLAVRSDRLKLDAAGMPALPQLVRACALAGKELAGDAGPEALALALPERDRLHLSTALGLNRPLPAGSFTDQGNLFSADGRLPAGAIERLQALLGASGRTLAIDVRSLVDTRFT